MNRQKKALVLPGVTWDDTYQRHHLIAETLAKFGYNVTFVSGIPSSKFSFKKLLQKIISNKNSNKQKNRIVENVESVSLRLLWPGWYITDFYNKKVIADFCANNSDFDLVVCYLPVQTTISFLDCITCKQIIYDCVRDFEGWGGYPRSVRRIEDEIISRSTWTFCDSYYLQNKLSDKIDRDKIFQIPLYFPDNLKIYDIKKIDSIKNIAYIGTISESTDMQVIENLLGLGYTINLYGFKSINTKEHERFIDKGYFSDISLLTTVVRDENDAIIIPYQGNMNGVIPAKLSICLSLGLPVFINSFYDSDRLSDRLFVYNDIKQLAEMIEDIKTLPFEEKYTNGVTMIHNSKKNTISNILSEILHENSEI